MVLSLPVSPAIKDMGLTLRLLAHSSLSLSMQGCNRLWISQLWSKWSCSGCPWKMPAGSCTKVTSFLCLLLILLAFLVSPSHTDMHWALSSGGHCIDVWHWCWQHGAHVPRWIPNSTAWCTLSVGTPRKEVSYIWARAGSAVQQWNVKTHSHRMEGGQPCRLRVKMTSSNDRGKAATEPFFLGQVKCP